MGVGTVRVDNGGGDGEGGAYSHVLLAHKVLS